MLKKYLVLARVGMLEKLHFRQSIVSIFFGNLVFLLVVYSLWKAIYASNGYQEINGMTFQDAMLYMVLASSMFSFMEVFLVWNIGTNVKSGKIVLDLIKPMNYQAYMFFAALGEMVVSFVLTFLPTAIIVYFVSDKGFKIGTNLIYFLISVILGILINYFLSFIVGTICLHTQSVWGINIMKDVIVSFLSGVTIPISFFPDAWHKVINFTPFPYIFNAPLSILLSKNITNYEMVLLISKQFFWAVCIMIISSCFWKRELKMLTINGG